MISAADSSFQTRNKVPQRRFDFERDTFAFRNELFWEYQIDVQTGQTKMVKRVPPPSYAHHCFVLVRSARQFFRHARFQPESPVIDPQGYAELVRKVVHRNPRTWARSGDEVVIPGYDCLRQFSLAQEVVLKQTCGGAWQSYFLRSHWRMILPFSRRHQELEARRLVQVVQEGKGPIVHILRFPQLTINHGLLVFDCIQQAGCIDFIAYDPNVPGNPSRLLYDAGRRTFFFERNHYFAGGRVDVFEVYRNWRF